MVESLPMVTRASAGPGSRLHPNLGAEHQHLTSGSVNNALLS